MFGESSYLKVLQVTLRSVMKFANLVTLILSGIIFDFSASTATGCANDSIFTEGDCESKCNYYHYENHGFYENGEIVPDVQFDVILGKAACLCLGRSETYHGRFSCCDAPESACESAAYPPNEHPVPNPFKVDACVCLEE
jgi:hypothetical protein